MLRRFAALAVVLLLCIPGSTLAARLTRSTDHSVSLACDGINSIDGGAFLFFGATISDTYGSDAGLDLWFAPQPTGDPDLSRDFDQPATVTWNGTTFAGSVPLRRADGSSAGSATFSATLTPSGAPTSFTDSFKDGNHRVVFSGTDQAYSATGFLTIPAGPVFDLGGCRGDDSVVTTTATNPSAYTSRFSSRLVNCALSNAAGDSAAIFIDLSQADGAFIDVGLFAPDGSLILEATDFVAISNGTIDSDLPLYDPNTGDPLAGGAHISATVTATSTTFTNLMKNATQRRTTRGQLIDIEGTVTLAGHSFDLGACVGQDSTTKIIQTNPQGPKPGGKVPANDLPTHATTLRPGSTAMIQTKGAAPAAEAPYECLTFTDPNTGEVFSVPVGYTVWYTFTGTGATMTVDTAGSDYDTVAAIYTASAGTYTPVANGCDDDTPTPPIGRSLQASVTIPTVAGTTYLVQIGGFPESFAYGNLRVSLR
jgi:hypothetical protein